MAKSITILLGPVKQQLSVCFHAFFPPILLGRKLTNLLSAQTSKPSHKLHNKVDDRGGLTFHKEGRRPAANSFT